MKCFVDRQNSEVPQRLLFQSGTFRKGSPAAIVLIGTSDCNARLVREVLVLAHILKLIGFVAVDHEDPQLN